MVSTQQHRILLVGRHRAHRTHIDRFGIHASLLQVLQILYGTFRTNEAQLGIRLFSGELGAFFADLIGVQQQMGLIQR